ncbi:MAG: S26 family signal peptidase [Candidatus Altiarchaeota archaeon]
MNLEKMRENLIGFLREISEVILTLLIIILVSRLVFGANMLVPLVAVSSKSMLHQSDSWKSWLISQGFSEKEIEKFPMQNGFDKGDMILVITPNGKGKIFNFEFPTLFPETKLGDVIIYERDLAHFGGEPIIHRVVGIAHIKNWNLERIDGTLSCISAEEIEKKFIPMVVDCINRKQNCPYKSYPKKGDFNFYITKGDNNAAVDQCGTIAYPVNDEQLLARGWIRLPYIGWLKLLLNEIINLFL